MSTLQEPPLTEQTGGLRRNLKKRHLLMMSLGGTIGTGLFISRWDNAGDDDVSWRIIVRVSPLWLISALCIDVYSKPDLELYHRVAILV